MLEEYVYKQPPTCSRVSASSACAVKPNAVSGSRKVCPHATASIRLVT